MIYTSLCNTLPFSHASCVPTGGNMKTKVISYGIAIAICSGQFFLEEKNKSISCLYVQYAVLALNQMYKTRELKNKAELKDRKARCIKPV